MFCLFWTGCGDFPERFLCSLSLCLFISDSASPIIFYQNNQSEAEINCFYFRKNQRTRVETWLLDPEHIARCSESHRDVISLLRVSGGSQAPAVLPTLSSFLSCSRLELKDCGCFGCAAACQRPRRSTNEPCREQRGAPGAAHSAVNY